MVQAEWPEEWQGVDIAVKELILVVIAAALWGQSWQGQHICFLLNNMAVVAILNSRTANPLFDTPTVVLLILLCLLWLPLLMHAHSGGNKYSS